MKIKLLSLTLAVITALTLLVSCNTQSNTNSDKYALKIGTIKGPTGMGMAKVINDDKEVKKYSFEIFDNAEAISSKLLGLQLDVAAVPVNLAAVVNKRTNGAYVIAAINTLGVLYVMENGNTVQSISDLAGKTVHAYGQGATPEYMLNYVLEKNGIKDQVIIEWHSDPAALSAQAAQGSVDIIILPEPQVTAAIVSGKANGNTDIRTALDLSAEWDKVSETNAVQGCIVVKKEIAQKYPDILNAFLNEYKSSVEYVNANHSDAAAIIANIGILPKAAIAEKAIPRCNIVFIDGAEMKTALNAFYQVLFNANPASIGGTLPSDNIYYEK